MTRVAELTEKLLDDTLTDDECAELESLVSADPAAEAEHLALLELEAELRGLRTDFDLTDATLAKVQAEQATRTANAVLSQIASEPVPAWAARPAEPAPRTPQRGAMWLVAGLMACAAAILVVLILNGTKPEIPAPGENRSRAPPFAKLSRKSGAVEVFAPSGEAILADEGGDLPAGFTVRTHGDDSLAVVELLQDKTRVEIEPDSVVRFAGTPGETSGKSRVFLAAGQLTAAVLNRPDDQPMIVSTAVAEVFVRNGTFVMSSAGPDSARVDIKKGKVELARTATPKRETIGVGGAAVVFAGLDRLDIEHTFAVDRTPRRTLVFPGPRDATFSPDGSEVWIANARAFTRWPAGGKATETSFYPRKGNDGFAAFTHDKRFLFTFRGTGERDDRVLVRTIPDGGEHAAINARPNEPRFWAVAPDASWMAVVDPRPNNKRVRVFDGATGEERFVREFDEPISCITATSDSNSLAVGINTTGRGTNNKVIVLDANTSDRHYALAVLRRPLTAMKCSPDGRFLAAAFNGAIQLWDLRNQELFRAITGFERVLTCLAFSPDGKRLAAGTPDGHVWVWNTESGLQTQLIEAGGRGVRSVAFSPNGKELVVVTTGTPIAVWEIADRPLLLPKFP